MIIPNINKYINISREIFKSKENYVKANLGDEGGAHSGVSLVLFNNYYNLFLLQCTCNSCSTICGPEGDKREIHYISS